MSWLTHGLPELAPRRPGLFRCQTIFEKAALAGRRSAASQPGLYSGDKIMVEVMRNEWFGATLWQLDARHGNDLKEGLQPVALNRSSAMKKRPH
jgi:hypothetical protein